MIFVLSAADNQWADLTENDLWQNELFNMTNGNKSNFLVLSNQNNSYYFEVAAVEGKGYVVQAFSMTAQNVRINIGYEKAYSDVSALIDMLDNQQEKIETLGYLPTVLLNSQVANPQLQQFGQETSRNSFYQN